MRKSFIAVVIFLTLMGGVFIALQMNVPPQLEDPEPKLDWTVDEEQQIIYFFCQTLLKDRSYKLDFNITFLFSEMESLEPYNYTLWVTMFLVAIEETLVLMFFYQPLAPEDVTGFEVVVLNVSATLDKF